VVAEAVMMATLDRAECLRLLSTVPVGRLIFTVNALPTVRPVNFAVAHGLILIRSAPDSTMVRKIHDSIVAFEADELDPAIRSGWSVTVTGRAHLVVDPDAIARYRAVPLVAWAPGVRDQFVTVTTELVEGRRIGEQAPAVC
jgi:nitroimidazol reductase NimA-like FMN-containing flavoprotein (pyridoxamine 5'-phosphate oxidase superfamily)